MSRSSIRVAEQESADTAEPRAVAAGAPRAAEVLVFACLVGFGVASIAAQSPGGADRVGLSAEVLIGGWVVVFAALATLYSQDRRSRALRQAAAQPSENAGLVAGTAPVEMPKSREAPEAPRAIESLLRRKTAPAPDPDPPAAPESAPEPLGFLQRSIALSAEGRFVEASRIAHDGLANGEDPGPLLVALSGAELARGQVDRAIDSARDALFVSRNPASVANLIRVLTKTRRFGPADGQMLRRAAARHPERAMLRHALGVFESMHGDPGAARDQLLAALQLEANVEGRQAIERDLDHTRQAIARIA